MKIRDLVGQLTLIGISGPVLTNEEKKFIIENNIGGIVLFARNLIEPRQIRDLCAEIQSLRHKMPDRAPLFIGIDMEGGRVHRLQKPFTQWPPLKKIGDLDAPTVAFNFSFCMGLELMSVGINLDFAPCIDVFTNPLNTIIGDRAVSSDPQQVEKMASALVRGFIKSGVMSCAKHFPGHGHTVIDSHEDLPIETADINRLNSVELVPFRKALRSRVDMVMTAHILFKNIDPKLPVTLSPKFLKQIVRDELKYRGLIITDDLDMKAMAKHYDKAEIPVLAFQAGADLILYCNETESPPMAIESVVEAVAQQRLSVDELTVSHQKVIDLKKIKLIKPDPQPFEDALEVIGCQSHLDLAMAIAEGRIPAGLIEN
jgi:beta-N-acetylhexosaminidase